MARTGMPNRECAGPWTSEIGPELFGQADIATDPDEMDFEIPEEEP